MTRSRLVDLPDIVPTSGAIWVTSTHGDRSCCLTGLRRRDGDLMVASCFVAGIKNTPSFLVQLGSGDRKIALLVMLFGSLDPFLGRGGIPTDQAMRELRALAKELL